MIQFLPYGQFRDLPESSGVYFLIFDAEIVYVGQSVNLKNRWASHNLLKEARSRMHAGGNVKLAWINVGREHLDEVETLILRHGSLGKSFRYNNHWHWPRFKTLEEGASAGLPYTSHCGVPIQEHLEPCQVCTRLDELLKQDANMHEGLNWLSRAMLCLGYDEYRHVHGNDVLNVIQAHSPEMAQELYARREKITQEIKQIRETARNKTRTYQSKIFIKCLNLEIDLVEIATPSQRKG